jgi:hypothetical protein
MNIFLHLNLDGRCGEAGIDRRSHVRLSRHRPRRLSMMNRRGGLVREVPDKGQAVYFFRRRQP